MPGITFKVEELLVGMHARVRAAATCNLHVFLQHSAQRILYSLLHAVGIVLRLPPVVPRSQIGYLCKILHAIVSLLVIFRLADGSVFQAHRADDSYEINTTRNYKFSASIWFKFTGEVFNNL